MKNKVKYYSLKKILSKQAQYNIIFGERSNGKTYSVLEYGLKNYCATGEQMGVIRRWKEDFRGKRGEVLFSALVENGLVSKYTNDEFNNIHSYAGKWYLCKIGNDGKRVNDDKPFCFGFALSDMEHDKSTSYPSITTVLFDEFLTRRQYFTDEFVLFMNVLSTIIRQRNNVKIFMLGNTVNKYCPYFAEMGLSHIDKMKQGTIDVYTYGNNEHALRVAVEYAGTGDSKKPSDIYFAFDNPKLNMIKGGEWELNLYPHLPYKYKPKDVIFTFFILFDENTLQCEVVNINTDIFIYIHRKTTDLKDIDHDLIYTVDYSPRINFARDIYKPVSKVQKKIAVLFKTGKVFYQSNDIGEIVRNYLLNGQIDCLS